MGGQGPLARCFVKKWGEKLYLSATRYAGRLSTRGMNEMKGIMATCCLNSRGSDRQTSANQTIISSFTTQPFRQNFTKYKSMPLVYECISANPAGRGQRANK